MEQKGCTVPQYTGEPNNVVSGDLDGDGTDGDFSWLCSQNDSTQLLAYTTSDDVLGLTEPEPDDAFWMGWFSRSLALIGAEEAERYNRRKRDAFGMEIPVATHGTLTLTDLEKRGRHFYYLRGIGWIEWEAIH